MHGRTSFDTNILVYAVASQVDENAGSADERARAGALNRKKAVAERIVTRPVTISVQLLNEFSSVALRKLGMRPSAVLSIIEGLALVHRIAPLDADLTRLALQLHDDTGYGYHDCLMLASALAQDCDVLYSEDMAHGHVVAERLRIVNPFHADAGRVALA